MTDFLKWFNFSINLLPLILQVIGSVEQTMGPGNGDAKKALVMTAVAHSPVVAEDSVRADAIASALIDSSVTALNAAGKLGAKKVG